MLAARRLLLILEDNEPSVFPPAAGAILADNGDFIITDSDQFLVVD